MNYYARAIELLQEEQDWKAIAFDYAKRHPSDFTRAAEGSEAQWITDARNLVNAGHKVAAVKLCRNETGQGLKEAKEYVESLATVAQ